MTLREKINEDFKIALKNKNKTAVSTMRLILAAIKEKDIANRTEGKKNESKDADIIKVLTKMKKQRQDSIELYKKGNRQELLKAEEEETKIIDSYLPAQLSEEETIKICKEAVKSSGASSMKDMGKIMGLIKQKHSNNIDFSKVNVIVKGLLSS